MTLNFNCAWCLADFEVEVLGIGRIPNTKACPSCGKLNDLWIEEDCGLDFWYATQSREKEES
jgi:hypothetical protein